jgi:hypothetical protein
MSLQNLQRRIKTLETVSNNQVSNDEWFPAWCNPNRRLDRHAVYFRGEQWKCTGTPEQKARKEAKLARYKAYFDNLGVHVDDDESLNNLN